MDTVEYGEVRWSLTEIGNKSLEEPAAGTQDGVGREMNTKRRCWVVKWSQGEMSVRGSRRDRKAHLPGEEKNCT